jgi:hypothetical protein
MEEEHTMPEPTKHHPNDECTNPSCIQEETIESLQKTVAESIAGLRHEIQSLSNKFDAGTWTVTILNSRGIAATMKLQDIIQDIYTPGKRNESVFNRFVVVAKGIVWIIGAIILLSVVISQYTNPIQMVLKP